MDRDTILANFQEISQIQDFEECIQILESVDWDLQSAVNSLDQIDIALPEQRGMDLDFVSYSPLVERVHSLNQIRELSFNVDFRGKSIVVNIPENRNVGDLHRMISNQIKEPQTRLKINGLKNPYDEFTILRNMKLPLVSNVVANIIDSNNSISAGSSTNEVAQENYTLSIEIYINDVFSQTLPLSFNGKDTIDKVKSHLSFLTGTEKGNQKWTGWPIYSSGFEVTLEESGIPKECTLTVHIDLNSRRVNDFTSPLEMSLSNSRDMDYDDDYGDDDYGDDIELLDEERDLSKKRTAALMDPTAHINPTEAVIQFSAEFSTRYCSQPCKFTSTVLPDSSTSLNMTPPFYMGSIDDAISSTINLSPHERKPLFIYLHHGESIQANIFCTQILCYSEVCLFFHQSEYTLWPWDVTYTENKAKFMTWIARNFGVNVSSALKVVQKDQYPVIVVINKSQGVTEILGILDGMRTKEEIVSHLWDIKAKFEEKKLPDMRAWEEMQLRDLVKQEQDAAYQESLLQDIQKEQIKNVEDQRIKDEELKAVMEKEKVYKERINKVNNAAKKLPKEPEEGPETITIRLRAPLNGNVASTSSLTRRFLESHTLEHLIAYIESLGFLRSEYKLLTTYPRNNLTDIKDYNITLKKLGIPKRETLILEIL